MQDELKKIGRKLLVASIGVATVNYGACGGHSLSTDKDAAVDGAIVDAGADSTDAAKDEAADGQGGQGGGASDASPDVSSDTSPDRQFVGNLIP